MLYIPLVAYQRAIGHVTRFLQCGISKRSRVISDKFHFNKKGKPIAQHDIVITKKMLYRLFRLILFSSSPEPSAQQRAKQTPHNRSFNVALCKLR